MMVVDRIAKLLPIPDVVSEALNVDWSLVQTEFQVDPPQEYKDFVGTYGSGSLDDYLFFLNPSSANHMLNIGLVRQHEFSYQFLKERYPKNFPRPKLPNTQSMLPWAYTIDGDTFTWIVEGPDPTKWNIGIIYRDFGEELFDFGFSEFMVRLTSRTLISEHLPRGFLETNHKFMSYKKE